MTKMTFVLLLLVSKINITYRIQIIISYPKYDVSNYTSIPCTVALSPHFIDEIDGKNKQKADSLIGSIDTVYLSSYAIFLFLVGMIADRSDLRYFLAGGCIMSGIMTILFGMAKYWNIGSIYYFYFVQVHTNHFTLGLFVVTHFYKCLIEKKY